MQQAIKVDIEPCSERDLDAWIAMRLALWPESPERVLRRDAEALFKSTERAAVFLAHVVQQRPVAFAEATLRSDYVNGCDTSPVAFLEGLYVQPEWRGRGIARELCTAVEQWGRSRNCRELASDTFLDNLASQRVHQALHFEEMERVVYFRKRLL